MSACTGRFPYPKNYGRLPNPTYDVFPTLKITDVYPTLHMPRVPRTPGIKSSLYTISKSGGGGVSDKGLNQVVVEPWRCSSAVPRRPGFKSWLGRDPKNYGRM